jgi:hypothetical protein
LRFGVFYTLLYISWLSLGGVFIRLLSAGAQTVLALVEHPPIITALTVSGNIISVHSYFTGQPQPIASWNGEKLHIFMVASLALFCSVPLRSRSERVKLAGLSLVLVSLVMLAICVVQLKSVAEMSASTRLGITLHTNREKAFLEWANRGLIMLGMLLVPAFIFLTSYLSFWSDSQVRAACGDRGTGSSSGRIDSHRPLWKAGLFAVTACGGAIVLLVAPHADPTPEMRLEGLHRILALNPSSAQARFSIGFHYEQEWKPDRALEFYQAALRLDPNLVVAHFGMGNVFFRKGDFDQAIRCYEEVLKRDPSHASARYNLGNALFERGLYAQAAHAYEEILTLMPNHASAHKNLGVALTRLERPCEALGHLKRSTVLDRRYFTDASLGDEISRLRSLCEQQ